MIRSVIRDAADLAIAGAVTIRDRWTNSEAAQTTDIDVETAAQGLTALEAFAQVAAADSYLRVANYEAYLRLLGGFVFAWVIANQLGSPDIGLQAVFLSVAALIYVLISTAMQAIWEEGIAVRAAIEDLAQEADAMKHARSDEERSYHYRRAAIIAEHRLRASILSGERATDPIGRLRWLAGQLPWIALATVGTLALMAVGAALMTFQPASIKSMAQLTVYGIVWVWAGYTVRFHFAPRRKDIGRRAIDYPARRLLDALREARVGHPMPTGPIVRGRRASCRRRR